MTAGTLYLVPAPLDFGCDVQVELSIALPVHTIEVAAQLEHWICENAKSTRAYLKRLATHVPHAPPLRSVSIVELPRAVHKKGDHRGEFDASGLLGPALAGAAMGLVCEAGMPALADPGSSVVRAAHQRGVRVVPLVGPTSLMLGLAASGLGGQSFAFAGYVPVDPAQRRQRLLDLEATARKLGQSQIVIETPYRNQALADTMLEVLRPDTWLAISAGLTLDNSAIRASRIAQWRQSSLVMDNKIPSVFCFGL